MVNCIWRCMTTPKIYLGRCISKNSLKNDNEFKHYIKNTKVKALFEGEIIFKKRTLQNFV